MSNTLSAFLAEPAGAVLSAAPGLDALRYRPAPTVRVVRGSRMRTKAALLDELAAALQFPLHFGGNWDALADCLGDLDWIRASGTVVLAVAEAEQVLADQPAELATLASVLADATGDGARLAVLLHASGGDPAAVRKTWGDAGLALTVAG
ncbi:barstar family protein [Tsukamurella soli]|uniref:Barstar (barnase inhibitor) domain-containing protein n=1 Tax=Tsukamurella soli TaxID=644556 RepID=A0ABP8KG58_9ACTN